ncbi:LORF2 protein, partial [Crocuta crocuta]
DPEIPLLGIYPKETKSLKKIPAPPHSLQPYLQLDKTWKKPKCLLTDEWIKKLCTYAMEYYSGMKKKIPFITTQLDFEDIMLSGRSQADKDKHFMLSLTCRV